MSRADGVLRVVLTGKWFDMIESGEKLEEYRKDKEGKVTWAKKLLSRKTLTCSHGDPIPDYDIPDIFKYSEGDLKFANYHTLVASRGYTSRILTRKIKRIRWGKPRPEWSGNTVTGGCFIIELEPVA